MIAVLPEGFGALAAVATPSSSRPDESGWAGRFDEVASHGLCGLLAEAWRRGLVELSGETQGRLDHQLGVEAQLAVRLEAEILRLSSLIQRCNGVILKGASLAHGAYPDPSWRPFTDIDLLVPTRSLTLTIEGLAEFGYSPPSPDPSPGFRERVGKATTIEHPAGLVIDLHRTLATGNLGEGIDVDALLTHQTVISAGAVTVPAPDWPDHLIEVCLHALVGDGLARAISLRDVVQVAHHPDLDVAVAIERSARWGVAPVVATGVRAAHEALGVPIPAGLAAWAMSESSQDARLRPGNRGVQSARLRLDEIRHGHPRRRLTLLRSLVAPTPAFLRWRYGPGRLPTLYCRRWTDLYRRQSEGRRK